MSVATYEEFVARLRELAAVSHAQGLLHWDQETCMPSRGAAFRAQSLGALAGIRHEKLTDPRLVQLVDELSGQDLSGDGAVNVRELKRDQDRALKVPGDLVVALSECQSLSREAWAEARAKSDFTLFLPWLEKILDLQKQVAHKVGFEGSMYNAFLDEYEPHARVEEVEPILAELRQRLVPLVESILALPPRADDLARGEYDLKAQEAFGRQIVADMGFDMEAGRLDVAVHPFCASMSVDDVRLTTRYNLRNLTDALFGTVHEAGHGLYEQGLPRDAAGTPAGSPVSLGIHESQSRLWENMIARSRPFWEHYLPRLKEHFPRQLEGVDVDTFYRAVNRVEASCIRVEADEVTYDLHILLRFELEKALVDEEIAVADLPGLWNDRMDAYLGVRPDTDALGVLQDVHWSSGLVGYFPTYTLGNLYAAQFFHRAQEQVPGMMAGVGRGELQPVLAWLRENVHSRGGRLMAAELAAEVTGEPLRVDYLVEYLEAKYGSLYGLS